MTPPATLEFDVIINASLIAIQKDISFSPAENKRVLSLINDFEDGKWREDVFLNFVWDNLAESALTQQERSALLGSPHSLLARSARNLRLAADDENGQGSELAEAALYGIMKHHYGALPVVPKIFYKQNTQDFAKGADSVHIVLRGKDFDIWFGEAKIYSDVTNSRLYRIVTSVRELLRTDKLRKENSVITNLSELDSQVQDKSLLAKIKKCLSNRTSLDTLKPRLHVPILLIHQCEITKSIKSLSDEYVKALTAYHIDRASKYFAKQVDSMGKTHLYSKITFHLILFPIPSKKKVVDRFVSTATELRGDGAK